MRVKLRICSQTESRQRSRWALLGGGGCDLCHDADAGVLRVQPVSEACVCEGVGGLVGWG
jgi:hypothetical protein